MPLLAADAESPAAVNAWDASAPADSAELPISLTCALTDEAVPPSAVIASTASISAWLAAGPMDRMPL